MLRLTTEIYGGTFLKTSYFCRKGNTNVFFLVGGRVLRHFDLAFNRERKITDILSGGIDEHVALVEKLSRFERLKVVVLQQQNSVQFPNLFCSSWAEQLVYPSVFYLTKFENFRKIHTAGVLVKHN